MSPICRRASRRCRWLIRPDRTILQQARFAPSTGRCGRVVPELNQQDSDHELVKQTWGAFMNPELDRLLRELAVTQVVVIGIATSFGVESTARQAHEYGYHVTLATDAMTDFSVEAHEGSVTRIFPSLGETGRTEEILALLERTSA
ncbi:isochorismatase family protein [Nocardia vaccinii]|uniref:isochorismatase family protein n=1 Tax=Nocardia vaccinii TaxID=1822 RepID=UPI001C3F5ECF|nr:isochorismatase family protein [Nocardia vaccinii]